MKMFNLYTIVAFSLIIIAVCSISVNGQYDDSDEDVSIEELRRLRNDDARFRYRLQICKLRCQYKNRRNNYNSTKCFMLIDHGPITVTECVHNCLKDKREKLPDAQECYCKNGECVITEPPAATTPQPAETTKKLETQPSDPNAQPNDPNLPNAEPSNPDAQPADSNNPPQADPTDNPEEITTVSS